MPLYSPGGCHLEKCDILVMTILELVMLWQQWYITIFYYWHLLCYTISAILSPLSFTTKLSSSWSLQLELELEFKYLKLLEVTVCGFGLELNFQSINAHGELKVWSKVSNKTLEVKSFKTYFNILFMKLVWVRNCMRLDFKLYIWDNAEKFLN